MSNMELIKELRALTSAGMKDCKDALEETGWDLQKAVDAVKVKGLNIADGRTGRIATDGRAVILSSVDKRTACMVEVNCQTDFVAANPDFVNFTEAVAAKFMGCVLGNSEFDVKDVEDARKEVVSTIKENIVVRRWQAERVQDPRARVYSYLHSNNKIGVMITLLASTETIADAPEFAELGNDLAMQICAMNPLAVSAERVSQEDKDRQKAIFQTQLQEEKKPEKMWDKILEGKFRKWSTEVCLLEQESVVVAKTAVKQVVKGVGAKLGGEITVVHFVRYQVGEGIEKKQENLAEEVAKLTGPTEDNFCGC